MTAHFWKGLGPTGSSGIQTKAMASSSIIQAPKADLSDPIQVIGHRGYSTVAPENTLASIEAALAAGAPAVEFDLQFALCGTPILFHDERLERTTNGVGRVDERTLKQLQVLDAGIWFSSEFTGERIPSFVEALELLNGRVDHIYPEIKRSRTPEDLDQIVRLVRDRSLLERTTFISIDWTALEHVRTADPNVEIGFIVVSSGQFPEALALATSDPRAILDLSHEFVLRDPSVVERARAAGLRVATWTVNDPEEATILRKVGVSHFTTDQVKQLVAWASSAGV